MARKTPVSANIFMTLMLSLGGILLLGTTACDSGVQASTADTLAVEMEPEPQETIKKATFLFVGDLMCHSTQFSMASVGKDSFNFLPCFAEIKPVIAGADLAVGNLETTLTGKSPYSGYPQFNTPDAYLDAVVDCGFDFLVTSNNHSMDTKEPGLVRTLEQIRQRGIGSTGTHLTQEDRDSVRVVDVNGFKMAILNYTYGTNGLPLPEGKPWSVNLIDTALVRRDIMAARETEVEIVTVMFHFGAEYGREPDAYQKFNVDHAIACGADLVIGGHPHVVQPAKYFKTAEGARLDTGFVAYSLGNFVSNQYKRYTDAGIIVQVELSRDLRNDSIFISDVAYVPTWVYRGRSEKKKIHVIFPAEYQEIDSLYPYLDEESMDKMGEAFSDTKEIFTKYSPGLRMMSVKHLLKDRYVSHPMEQ